MKENNAYAFPLYHRIGQLTHPVVTSRYWILVVLMEAILLYAPFLVSGFFQDDYGFRLQFAPEIFERGGVPADLMRNGPLNLYGFSGDSSARLRVQQERGFAPWWASPAIKTNF